LGYIIYARPFEELVTNAINIYNETVISFTFISILIMNSCEFTENATKIWGWIIIIEILISLIITWYTTFIPAIKLLLQKLGFCITSTIENHKKAPIEDFNAAEANSQNINQQSFERKSSIDILYNSAISKTQLINYYRSRNNINNAHIVEETKKEQPSKNTIDRKEIELKKIENQLKIESLIEPIGHTVQEAIPKKYKIRLRERKHKKFAFPTNPADKSDAP